MPEYPEVRAEVPKRNSIEDVLAALDQIVNLAIRENSVDGLFAYVYRRTTAKVKEAIEKGRFDDNDRMERFDVIFAGKYIDAYWNYRNGKQVPAVWRQAFDPDGANHILLQHILLGMNAHINYDLGIAAAEFTEGSNIHELKPDFMLINLLLAELVDEVQRSISSVSPMMFLLDWLGKRDDEATINFSMKKAREQAWHFAVRLAEAPRAHESSIRAEVGQNMTQLAGLVANPPGIFIPNVLQFIRFFEHKDVGDVITNIQQ